MSSDNGIGSMSADCHMSSDNDIGSMSADCHMSSDNDIGSMSADCHMSSDNGIGSMSADCHMSSDYDIGSKPADCHISSDYDIGSTSVDCHMSSDYDIGSKPADCHISSDYDIGSTSADCHMSSDNGIGSKGMLHMKYFCSKKSSFVAAKFYGINMIVTNCGKSTIHPSYLFWDMTRFKTLFLTISQLRFVLMLNFSASIVLILCSLRPSVASADSPSGVDCDAGVVPRSS